MAKKFKIRNSTAEFLIFMAEGKENGVEVMYAEETIWCTQDAIASLFDKGRSTIAEHLSNIFKEGELDKNSVCRNFRRTAADGKSYNTQYYNLDAIISVGYRANSRRATQFRQWCTYVLRQYAIRGYVIDKKRMENGSFIGVDYFEQLLEEIRSIIDREQPDLLLGNSCGSFLAQMLAPVVGIPALLGNPYFMMTEFLKERIGEHEYKAPRRDGNQRLVIDEALIEEFAELEAVQFDHCNPYYKDRVWGLFGEQDTLAHFSPLFLEHYNQAFHFPGGHTPTEQEVKTWYAPLAQKMMMEFSANF